ALGATNAIGNNTLQLSPAISAFKDASTSNEPITNLVENSSFEEDWATQSPTGWRSEEHTSELQSRFDLVCRLLLEKKKKEKLRGRTTKCNDIKTMKSRELQPTRTRQTKR